MLHPLEQLERVANDEFHLLESLGPGEFSTPHLLELREQVVMQLQSFNKRQRMNILFAVTSVGWVLAFFAAYYYQQVWLALLAIVGILFALSAFIVGSWSLFKKFNSRGELEHTLRIIDTELRTRNQR